MIAKYQISITNTKTGKSNDFWSLGDYPQVDAPLRKMEDETPIKDIPEYWDIKVYRLL